MLNWASQTRSASEKLNRLVSCAKADSMIVTSKGSDVISVSSEGGRLGTMNNVRSEIERNISRICHSWLKSIVI